MVADDDPVARAVLRAVLELEGYEVAAAADGDEVVRLAAADPPPAALVVDRAVTGPTSSRLLARLREQAGGAAPPPLVLLSHRADGATRGVVAATAGLDGATPEPDPLDAGADALLTVPFAPVELLDVLDALLAER